MRFSTETRSREFPAVFERFEKTIGDNIWRRRAGKIRDDIRGNGHLHPPFNLRPRNLPIMTGYKHFVAFGYSPQG
jgi:hypothetical protein